MSPHRHLAAGLTDAQHEAVFSDASHLCIVAGAGSGKTRVLTRRIARRLVDDPGTAAETVAVTFTRKAAGELLRRLHDLAAGDEIRTGTFHGLAYRSLNEWWQLRDQHPWRVLEHKTALIAGLLPRHGASPPRNLVRAVAAEIDLARAQLVDPDRFETTVAGRHLPLPPADLADVYRRYQDEKRRRRVVDFEDLLLRWAEVLEDDPAFADAFVRRVRHVYVDEFQDVNPAQYRLLRALTAHPDATLCVVGDDDQAIYGFSGGDAGYLTEFRRIWPDAVTVTLTDNFRCPPEVLAVASRVLAEGAHRRGKMLRPHLPPAGRPELVSHADELAEAAWVADMLPRTRRPSASWRQCAVLVRTNAQLEPIQDALTARGVPTVVRGGRSFASNRLVKDVLERLRFAERQDARPPGQPFATFVAELAGLGDVLEIVDLADVATGADPGDEGIDPDRAALCAAAVEYELATIDTGGSCDAAGFATWLQSTIGPEPPDGGADAVALLTMHRAKGLEFDTVFVCGLEEGLMPISHARDTRALEEERRLLYVALTRSRRRLLLSYCRGRTDGAGVRARRRSRFLDVVCETLAVLDAQEEPATGQQGRLGDVRVALSTGRRADPVPGPLLADLRAWREHTAEREHVPAHFVLFDATLRELAACRPTDHAALARVPDLDAVRRRRYGSDLIRLIRGAESGKAAGCG